MIEVTTEPVINDVTEVAESDIKMPEANYVVFKLGYTSIIVTHSASLLLMKALEKAEKFDSEYPRTNSKIFGLTDEIEIFPISREQYMRCKVNTVLLKKELTKS